MKALVVVVLIGLFVDPICGFPFLRQKRDESSEETGNSAGGTGSLFPAQETDDDAVTVGTAGAVFPGQGVPPVNQAAVQAELDQLDQQAALENQGVVPNAQVGVPQLPGTQGQTQVILTDANNQVNNQGTNQQVLIRNSEGQLVYWGTLANGQQGWILAPETDQGQQPWVPQPSAQVNNQGTNQQAWMRNSEGQLVYWGTLANGQQGWILAPETDQGQDPAAQPWLPQSAAQPWQPLPAQPPLSLPAVQTYPAAANTGNVGAGIPATS